MKFQLIGYALGVLITVIGLTLTIPAIVDYYFDHDNAQIFFFNAVVCVFFGGGLIISNRSYDPHIRTREAFLLTIGGMIVTCFFCAWPLIMSNLHLSVVDAVFEAVSGITTTGATVLDELRIVSPGMLFWRSLMQWFGGFGFILFATILLPYLKVGGMQIFRSESAGHTDKVMPRSVELMASMLQLYAAMTAVFVLGYIAVGMNGFDALNHAMTTISTGGFTTYNESFARFQDNPGIHYAASIFMILSALPFIVYMRLVFQRKLSFITDSQVRVFLWALTFLVIAITLWLWMFGYYSLEHSFRSALFNVASIMTTTGYIEGDYTAWGGFTSLVFLILLYTGACAGSSGGGMKIMRLIVAWKVTMRQFKTLIYPNGVFVLNYQRHRLKDRTVLSVLGFLSLYVGANVIFTVLLAATGLDFETSMSAAAAALGNVGAGTGAIIGPLGSYADLPDSSKIILSLAMLFGRLELLAFLVIFTKNFWND
ncbi:MAG: TrkH family potassium uptake protein [Alphaproteobacteria bacterium]|nr:TrkH family potassium uptake protein [Alphaproteobacteria bacterium]